MQNLGGAEGNRVHYRKLKNRELETVSRFYHGEEGGEIAKTAIATITSSIASFIYTHSYILETEKVMIK